MSVGSVCCCTCEYRLFEGDVAQMGQSVGQGHSMGKI
jgi:hypothetical protein